MSRKYVVFGTKKFPARKCKNCSCLSIGIYRGFPICKSCLDSFKNGNKIKISEKLKSINERG